MNPLLPVSVFFALMAMLYLMSCNNEAFYIGPGKVNRTAAPYYTTTFQAYPGRYMQFGDGRHWKCLQQNQTYPGYRNCMLYFA